MEGVEYGESMRRWRLRQCRRTASSRNSTSQKSDTPRTPGQGWHGEDGEQCSTLWRLALPQSMAHRQRDREDEEQCSTMRRDAKTWYLRPTLPSNHVFFLFLPSIVSTKVAQHNYISWSLSSLHLAKQYGTNVPTIPCIHEWIFRIYRNYYLAQDQNLQTLYCNGKEQARLVLFLI